VIFTGHSLGGALAALAAAQTRVEGWRESGQITLYTFGQPRIGDYNFAIAHSQQIPNRFLVSTEISSDNKGITSKSLI
jgi:predicted lipase